MFLVLAKLFFTAFWKRKLSKGDRENTSTMTSKYCRTNQATQNEVKEQLRVCSTAIAIKA